MALQILPDIRLLEELVKKANLVDEFSKLGGSAPYPSGLVPQQSAPSIAGTLDPMQQLSLAGPSPGAAPLIPSAPPTAVDKIVGGLEKVNRVLEATPFLGHMLRSSRAEIQEREIPSAERVANWKTQQAIWEQMQENIRSAERDAAIMGAAGTRAAATGAGAEERAAATVEAARIGAGQREATAIDKELTSLIKQYEDAGDEGQKIIRQRMREMGFEVPEPEAGGSWDFGGWLKGMVGKAQKWMGVGEGGEGGGEGAGKSDPVGLFK